MQLHMNPEMCIIYMAVGRQFAKQLLSLLLYSPGEPEHMLHCPTVSSPTTFNWHGMPMFGKVMNWVVLYIYSFITYLYNQNMPKGHLHNP